MKYLEAEFVARIRALCRGWYPLRYSLLFLARGCALHLRRSSQSCWVHGESFENFQEAESFISALQEALPRHRFLLTCRRPEVLERIRGRFPDNAVLPAPVGRGIFLNRTFSLLTPQILFLLGSDAGFGPKGVAAVRRKGIPVLIVNADDPAFSKGLSPLPPERPDLVCIKDERAAAVLQESGLPSHVIAVTGDMAFETAPPVTQMSASRYRKELRLPEGTTVLLAEKIASAEEPLFIDVYAEFGRSLEGLILLVEPEHPRQMSRLSRLLKKRNIAVAMPGDAPPAEKRGVIFLGSPGEAECAYVLADAVLAGGSFEGKGPTVNPIGPGLAGTPVVYGPRVPPSATVARFFIDRRLSKQAAAEELAEVLGGLLRSPRSPQVLIDETRRITKSHSGPTLSTLDAVLPWLPEAPESSPSELAWRVRGPIQQFSETALGKKVVALRSRRSITDLEKLKSRLGHPHTIMCLGNGPSSEDARLATMAHDCLFRVNWRWKRRGFLTRPDVAFVGDAATVRKVKNCIFAFANIRLEQTVLLKHMVFFRPKPLEYFTLERLSSLVLPPENPARPSNGALMIAVAAALEPGKLVIAGIDLYLHPDGRYPGDARGRNQPAAVHDRNWDLSFIQRVLGGYRGEIVSIGHVLHDGLEGSLRGFPGG